MFLFLSFVVALISLYYLGVMVDTYNADTTYLTPLVALLIYSILTIIRECKKKPSNWLIDDDYGYDDSYGYNRYQHNSSNQGRSTIVTKANENTEYFTPDVKEKKNNEKELIHYPSNKEVREKIKQLENSRWFRIKRSIASVFAIDITAKYYEEYRKPYKVNGKGKVISINNSGKEDHNRFKPNNNWYIEREMEEYNAVTKLMNGRSCEIALTDGTFDEETNNSENIDETE